MVSTSALIAMLFTLTLSIILPLGLVFYYYKKERISMKAVLVGAAVFIIFQILTRIPLLQYLSAQAWYSELMSNMIFASLFLSLTTGLFEETGRYIGFKYFLKDHLEWKNGVAYGLGHGGIEAIGLVGLSYVNNLVLSIMINAGTFEQTLNASLGSAAAVAIKAQLINTAPLLFAVGGIERVFTLLIQIALSLIVLYGVMKQKPVYLIYAILLHALIDIPAVIFSAYYNNLLVAELIIMGFAVLSYIFIKQMKVPLENNSLD